MRRQFPAGILYWLTVGLMFFVSAAGANVIYDVEVNYEGGYKYAFAMEFATIKSAYTEADLIPGGYFQQERFFQNGTEWHQNGVVMPGDLLFNPGTGLFSYYTMGYFYSPSESAYTYNVNDLVVRIRDVGTLTVSPAASRTITLRQPEAIPEPASVTLLGLGLAGLAGMRRRAKKQSSPALILHDTNAASA